MSCLFPRFVSSGMIASEYFNVTGNALSQSTIPAGWYSKTLQLIAIGWNNISGAPRPLPAGRRRGSRAFVICQAAQVTRLH